MQHSLVGAIVRRIFSRATIAFVFLLLAGVAGDLRAQGLISVPFTDGFIGTRGSSAGTSNNVRTYATLGIARTFFMQNSSTNTFELQGNDIPGTLRIVRTDGTTLDIPASANWRNSGGTTYLIGILPRPASAITFTYAGGSIQITNGAVAGGTSIGGYVAAYTGAVLTDGASTSGNAAQSQVLDGLNSYLGTVVMSRPAGPVTVAALTTTSTTPTLSGKATLGAGENLSVVVDGVQYTTGSSPALVRSGDDWSLTLTSPLAPGTYSITATITNTDGFTLSDPTDNEMVITPPTVTLAGTFTADDKVYDGSTAATGTTSGLTLVGVTAPDEVTITSVGLAFQTAAAGSGRTVVITGVTLGGTDAAAYSVDLTGAPTATASVTPHPLTISGVAAADKVYDAGIVATLAGTASYVGLVGGESFAVTGTPTASFASAAVGTARAVTVSGYLPPTANYTVTQPAGLTADILPKSVTIGGSFTAADKVFDGATAATIVTNGLTLVGVVNGEDVTLTGVGAAFEDAAVGSGKTVALSGAELSGAPAANYVLSLAGAPTTTASIVAAAPPSAPRNLAGYPADGALSITWDTPHTSACGPISGYVVEYSTDGGHNWTRLVITVPSPTSTLLSGLTNNVAHRVRVAAVNPCGMGEFAPAIGPVVPFGPARDENGRPPTGAPGTATITTGGLKRNVTPEIVQDTIVRIPGENFTLSMRAGEQSGAAIPVDSSSSLQLEHGGWITASGSGFAAGSFVTVYLLAASGEALLLDMVAVGPDGSFVINAPIPEGLASGPYTVQVNGLDRTSTVRSIALGVEVVPPPADLVLTATPDEISPVVGDTITITLTVTNRGRGPAIDVVIPRAFREPGFTIVKTTPLEGTYDADAEEWTIVLLEPGARARMLLTVVIVPPGNEP